MKNSVLDWTAVPPLIATCRRRPLSTTQDGISNLGYIAKAAAENRHMVIDLTASGWTPKYCKIEKLCETLK
jgi:hypothetical protein